MTHTELIDAVKRTPIRQLLRSLGYTMTSKDARFHPCPICHQGIKSPRDRGNVSIHSSGHGFYCYSCSSGGSSLDLLLYHHGIDPRRLDDAAFACMRNFLGDVETAPPVIAAPPAPAAPLFTAAQVRGWYRTMPALDLGVASWLHCARGIPADPSQQYHAVTSPRQLPIQRPDLREAAEAGRCAAFPLYSLASGEICNLVIRPITPFLPPGQSKPWKARTLNSGTGTTRDGSLPLVYGHPHATPAPRLIVIVEGALDQLTAAAMSTPDILVIGAFCADDIPQLGQWCLRQQAPIVLVPHIDKPTDRYPRGIGWHRMETLAAAAPCAQMIEWRHLLFPFNLTRQVFRESGRSDLNDLIRLDTGLPITTLAALTPIWRAVLRRLL